MTTLDITRLISIKEAAKRFGVSKMALYKRIKEETLKAHIVCGNYYLYEDELAKWKTIQKTVIKRLNKVLS